MTLLPVRWRFSLGIGLILALLALAYGHYRPKEVRSAYTPIQAGLAYAALRARLDPVHPGRGVADYPGFPVADVSKAYAMLIMAELEWRRRHPEHNLGLARAAVNWLLEHADQDGDGHAGWGVPVAWDAYGDGTVNPAHTEYAISTSLVVQALLDWLDTTPGMDAGRIEALVARSLDHWAAPELRAPSGMLPYSLLAADRRYDTFNPAAHLAGQMQRFSRRAHAPLADRLQAAADATMRTLLDRRLHDSQGNWYWPYSIQEANPNDLAHAVYIMEGIAEYCRFGGRFTASFDQAKVFGHLQAFFRADGAFLSAWPVFHDRINYPARAYDLGAGLWFAARRPELPLNLASGIANFLPMYLRRDGYYRKYPDAGDKKGGDDTIIGEYQAYILAGLAAWGR